MTAEAAQWVLRTERGTGDLRLRADFSRWLLRSPLHVEEYLAMAFTWEVLSLVHFGKAAVDAMVSVAKDAPDDFGNVH